MNIHEFRDELSIKNKESIMQQKVKYLSLTVLLLTLILLILIRINYPLNVSTTESVFNMIPIYFWILLLVIPGLITATFLLTDSKILCVFLAGIYFFVLYSFYLFFVIPPAGTDTVTDGQTFLTLLHSTSLSVEQISYFQWPIHFILNSVLIKIVSADFSIITLALFSFILMIPLFFYLFLNKKSDKKVFFILPVSYIILSFIFINSNWVPQFTGLIFLFLTIGCYVNYKDTESKIFYAMVLLFFTLCVFTHPFIFVFFPVAIILDSYILPKKIVKSKNKLDSVYFLILLLVIYFTGYVYRFTKMGSVTQKLFFGSTEFRGEAWNIIAYLFGSKQDVGRIDYNIFPLYDQVSRNIYLISRYSVFILLIVFVILLIYVVIKNLKKLKSFDISLGVVGSGFFLIGLINPVVLGQRAFQIVFLTAPQHLSHLFESKKKMLVPLLVLSIMLAPFLFTTNQLINQGLSGEKHIQDVFTINSGRFVMNFVEDEYNVLAAELSFYPTGMNNTYNSRSLIKDQIKFIDISFIIDSPKQINRMKYYGLEIDYTQLSKLYDNGDSKIIFNSINN